LWIFHNKETVIFKISPTCSSKVLIDHFGDDHHGGVLNVDRYGAYKVIAKSGLFILAFCWAHVRQDYLEHAKAYPEQEAWALAWVDKIGNLYHINNQRIQHKPKSKIFHQHDQALKAAIKGMKKDLKKQCADSTLLPSAKKLLGSLDKHWSGLIIFADFPDIPMDNNQAERGLRSSVLGRKNYYGSGAVWSAELAAMMFSIFKTLKLWGVNPHTWLLTYLQECAMHNGVPPHDVEKFLPWSMTSELITLFSKPPMYEHPQESLG
jgi:transposase